MPGRLGVDVCRTSDLVPASEAADRGAAQRWAGEPAGIGQVVLALDGSEFAERALPAAEAISRLFDATLNLVSVLPARGALRVLPKGRSSGDPLEAGQVETETYLGRLADRAKANGIRTATYVASGPVAQALDMLTRELDADLLVMSTHGRSGVSRFMLGSNASATIQLATRPVLMLRPQALAAGETPQVTRVLVPLDGSGFAEQVLPWVQAFANVSNAEMILLAVPEVPEPALYGAMREAVEELRERAEAEFPPLHPRGGEATARAGRQRTPHGLRIAACDRHPGSGRTRGCRRDHAGDPRPRRHGAPGPGQRGRPSRASCAVPGVFGAGARKEGRIIRH